MPATRYHDPASATLLSAAFTVVRAAAGIAMVAGDPEAGAGAWLFFAGLTLGPSIGYFTTGQTGRGFAGFGIRSGVFMGTALLAYAVCPVFCGESDASAGNVIAIGGLTVTAILAVVDIAKVRRKFPGESTARVRVYPTYLAATKSPGLGVNVTF
jgi:hypothetical protein